MTASRDDVCGCVRVCDLVRNAWFVLAAVWFSIPVVWGGAHEDGGTGVSLCVNVQPRLYMHPHVLFPW